jgi:hypothetical protein
MNMQGNTIKNNNKNKRKKLRTLVLSPNVNDYDTGEYLYPNNFHINDSQKDLGYLNTRASINELPRCYIHKKAILDSVC